MEKKGYDPRKADDRARYAREVAHQYMGRYRDMVKEAQGDHEPPAVWFNSRPKTNLFQEKKFLQHIEVECLPTGGWGYSYFPYVSRFVRPMNLPTLSLTGRFFKSWGDNSSLKPDMALKYECCQVLSQGMSIGIGDLLHPRGEPSGPVYDLIADVYEYIEKCEPYVEGGQILSQIAVVVDPELGDDPGMSGKGVTRALQQLNHQFDIIPSCGELAGYELLVIPETTSIDRDMRGNLQHHLQGGGSLLVCGDAALDEKMNPAMEELGIEVQGKSPFTHTFLHAEQDVGRGLRDYGYVMYEPGFRMQPAEKDVQVLVRVGEPYFERNYNHFSGHSYTPEAQMSDYVAAVRNNQVITFSVPILKAYGKHASPNYRTLLGNCIDLLMPEKLVRVDGPTSLEATVVRKDGNLVVHLLSFCAERRAEGLDIVEDAVPLVDMPIAVKVESEPRRVFLAPEGEELDFTYEGGYMQTRVTVLGGHAMLVVEE